jgi:endonuclease/exonuclease/phosphatase family metal-dependent hydrolase
LAQQSSVNRRNQPRFASQLGIWNGSQTVPLTTRREVQAQRIAAAADVLRPIDPDIILLQEFPDATFDFIFAKGLTASQPTVRTNASDHWPVTRDFHLR